MEKEIPFGRFGEGLVLSITAFPFGLLFTMTKYTIFR